MASGLNSPKASSSPCAVEYVERSYNETDFLSLLRIERYAGSASWSREQFNSFLTQPTIDTRVILPSNAMQEPIGFYVVEHGDGTLYLCNVAVALEWRREGVAAFALASAAVLGVRLGYSRLSLDVQEENLAAQLLYRRMGFRAESVRPRHYVTQDGIHMVRELR